VRLAKNLKRIDFLEHLNVSGQILEIYPKQLIKKFIF